MKRLLALLLSLCLLLSLAACGEPAETTQPKDTEPGKTTQPDTTEPDATQPSEEVSFLWDEDGSDKEITILTEMLYKDLADATEASLTMDITDKGQILSVSNEERNQQAQVEYDEKGFPTAIKVTEDGAVVTTVNFTFDASGNLLRVTSPEYKLDTSYTYDDNDNVLTITNPDSTEECTYDEKGNLLTSKVSRSGKLWEYTYTYDSDGNELTGKVTLDGELRSEWSNTYENGNLVSEKNDSDEYRYTYDDKGNQLTCDFYRDGEFVWNQTYTYDADGNCTSETSDGELKYESVYSEGGRHEIKKSYIQGYMVSRTTEYTYDDNGNELSKIIYNSDGEATDQWTSSYKTFSLTDTQAKVFGTLLEYLDELDLIYNG